MPASAVAMAPNARRGKIGDWGLVLLGILTSVFIVSFGLVNILKFRMFSPTCFGWQFFYMYPKLAALQNPFTIFIPPEFNIFILLAPINYLLAFVYSLKPNPEVLLVFQEAIMAAGAIPIYLIAKENLKAGSLALAFSVSYLLHPYITTGAILGYTPLTLGMPLFLYAFYYLEKKAFGRFVLFVLLANLAKVDATAMTIIMGTILFFSKTKKKYGITCLIIGTAILAASAALSLTYLHAIHRHFPVGLLHFNQYGNTLVDVLRYSLNNFMSTINNFFNPGTMLYSIFLNLPNIFSLLSPVNLLPVILEVMYVLIRNQLSTGHFLILTFVFWGAIYGIKKIIKFINYIFCKCNVRPPEYSFLAGILSILIITTTLLQHYYIKPKFDFANKLGPVPFSRDFDFGYYSPNRHIQLGRALLKLIPAGSSCLTTQSLAPHLGRCKYLGLVAPYVLSEGYHWGYVFVDLYGDDFSPMDRNQALSYLRQLITKNKYGVVACTDGWVLFKQSYVSDKNASLLNQLNKLLADEKKN